MSQPDMMLVYGSLTRATDKLAFCKNFIKNATKEEIKILFNVIDFCIKHSAGDLMTVEYTHLKRHLEKYYILL